MKEPPTADGDAADRAGAREGESIRRARFGLLLIAITAVFLVQGVANPSEWEHVLVSALLGATLLLALRVADARPVVLRPVAVTCGILVALSAIEALTGHGDALPAQAANLLLVTLAPPAVALGTIRDLRRRNAVTVEAVLGVLCLYLLIGMFFAAVYSIIGHINGTFFAQNVALTGAHCLYFSFTTLTTVGYGDFTASSNLGHTLSVSEALVGQIYLVTIVSLIVSNLGTSRRRGDVASP